MIANHPYVVPVQIKVVHADYPYLPLAEFSMLGKVYAGQLMIRAVAGVVQQHRKKFRKKAKIFRCALKIATTIHLESECRGVSTLCCTHEYIGFHKLSRRIRVVIEFR